MTIWLSAAEPSGDRWAASLAAAILRQAPETRLTGIVGPEMRRAGVTEAVRIERGSAMGFLEPLRSYRAHRDALKRAVASFRADPPDLVVAVDYPGFHLHLLREARSLGIPTMYYIPPQVWAWRPERARAVAKCADVIVTGFGFERQWFTEYAGTERVAWFGHPLADELPGRSDGSGRLVLLPGSRRGEVSRLAPVMARAARRLGIDAVFGLHADEARDWLPDGVGDLPVETGNVRELLRHARGVVACSGTVTLEVAVTGVPMAICYRTDRVTYAIARRLVRTPYIGLPNVLLNEAAYPELIQHHATGGEIAEHMERIMNLPTDIWTGRANRVRDLLGAPGTADRVAAYALEYAGSAA